MRALVALALVLAACGRSDRPDNSAANGAPTATRSLGPDPLMLRLPRAGGVARVVAYPRLDSVLWTSSDSAPSLDRVLSFDEDGGSIAFVDRRERPGRLDLRDGTVTVETGGAKARLSSIASIDGTTIYAVDNAGLLRRFTPSGDWSFKPPRPVRAVFPQPDGGVILFASREDSTVAWRIHPPDTRLTDTAELPAVERTLRTQLGDRLYLVSKGKLVGLRTRTLDTIPQISFESPIAAMVATPSGDRLFVVNDSSRTLSVLDRYRERVTQTIELPGQPDELRMDPLGRYLLIRQAKRDSTWVVAVATGQFIGTVRSRWRADLPFVAADGAIAAVEDGDVVFMDGATLRERTRVRSGADDFWYTFVWSGFRPRNAVLDTIATAPAVDTTIDTTRVAPPADTAAVIPPPTPDSVERARTPQQRGFVVSFAALLSEQRARELAPQIRVRGEAARVVTSQRDGVTIYRVVLGPFTTREEADRVGRESGQSNWWVYEGIP